MGKVFFFLVLSFLLINNLFECGGDILSNYDFDSLKNAVTDAFADDANMDHVMMARMVSFQERIRKERSSNAFSQTALRQDNEEADENVLFEPPSDYYSFDGVNLDFGDVDQVALDKILHTSVYHRESSITDLDTIELDNGRFVWFATRNMITTWLYPSTKKNDFKVYTFGLEGISKLEPIVLNRPVISNNSHERQILAIITLDVHNHDRSKQTLSWYSWNEYDNTLYRNGSLELSEESLDIRVFHIPVSDIHMLASLQTTSIRTYIVSLNDNGRLFVKSCTIIPIALATDLKIFTINGQSYAAVTNGPTTTVWKYRAHDEELGSTEVVDIQYFRIGYEHFLGVVDVGGSAIIYQWKGAIFVRIQTLRLPSEAVKWHSIVDDDEALLTLILKDQLSFFAWNKQLREFVSSGHWTDRQWTFRMDVRAISYSGHGDGRHILLVATDRTLIKFDVHLKRQQIATETITDSFIDEVQDIKSELDRQERFLSEASKLLKSLESKLNVPSTINSGSEAKPCADLNVRLETIEESLHSTKASMTSLSQHDLADKIHLRGKQTFRSVTVLETAEVRGNLKADSVNGLNMSHLFEDSIIAKSASYVSGLKTFTGRVVVRDGLKVTRSLNGLDPDDLVRLNKPQTILGMKFLAPVTVQRSVDVAGPVNGIDLSEEVILLSSDKVQTIKEDKVFVDDVTVENEVLVSGEINGVKLSKLAADTVTSSDTRRITGTKLFAQMTVKGDIRAHKVNGLDLEVLDSRIVRVDRPSIVTAPKTFLEDVFISNEGQLRIETLNGLRFPEDFVQVAEKRIVLNAPKDFARSVTVYGDLKIKGNLDGINLTDVMTTTGDQQLCGNKTFAGSVHVTHMEDIPSKPFVNTVVIHGNLHVGHTINNIPLNDFVLRNETNLVLGGLITFVSPQNLDGLVQISGLVNGLHLKRDFLRPYANQVVTGTKVFLKPVTVKGNLQVGHKLDGVDLRKLAKNVVSLSPRTMQIVSGRKSFVDGISIGDVLILPSLTSKDFFPKNLDLKSCTVKGNLMVDGFVNDVNFQELHATRMTMTTDQEILAQVQIRGSLHMDNLHLIGNMNGHNLSSFWNDVLLKDGAKHKQVFTGQKRFTGRVAVPQLFTRQGLNGLSIRDIKQRTIPIVTGKILSGSKYSFDGGIFVDGALDTHGTINGIEMTKTVMDSVRRHSHAYPVIGVKVFEELHVKGNVRVDGTVNDLSLERDVLTTNTPQNLTGRYTLRKDVRFTDNVTVNFMKAQNLHVHCNLAADSMTTGGNVNGINLQHLHGDAVLQSRSELQTIHGEKTFVGPAGFHKDVSAKSVNGFDYAKHFEDIVVADGTRQVVTGNKEFLSDVDAKGAMKFQGPVSLTGSLNGVAVDDELKRFEQPYVFDKPVTVQGSLRILGDVKTHNTLNGLSISRDVMTSFSQTVTAPTTIKTLIVDGDIKANSVNGWNLEVLRRDTLTTNGDQQVTGRKIVKGTVSIHPTKTPNRKPSAHFRKPQLHFHGNVTFLNGVSVRRDPLRELSAEPQLCNSISSCKTLSAINRATTQRTSDFLSMNLVQTVNVRDLSAMEVVKTRSKVLYVTGFSSCDNPMEIHAWNASQRKFVLRGRSNVGSVFDMRTVYGTDEEPLLCILHRNCRTGQNVTSIYSIDDEQLKLKSASETIQNVVDFDLQSTSGPTDHLLIATLQTSSRVILEKLVGSERKLLSVTDIPSSGDRISWLALSRGGPLLLISSRSSHTTVLYQSTQTGTLRHLRTLQACSLASWTLDSNIGFLVASLPAKESEVTYITVYKIELNRSGLDVVALEDLQTESKDTPTTVENIFDKTLQLCVVNFGHRITVYTKGLSGNYFRRSSMLIENVSRTIPAIVNGKLLLITNGSKGWNAYLSDLHHNNRDQEFNCFD